MGWVRPLLLGALLLATFPAAAAARRHHTVPPGNSAILEYVETIPSAGGASPTTPISHGSAGGQSVSGAHGIAGGSLTAATVRSLAIAGADGRAVVALSQATAPAGTIQRLSQANASGRAAPPRRAGTDLSKPQARFPAPTSEPTPSVASAVIRALTGSGPNGLGIVLPVMLAAGLLLGAVIARLRRRSR